MGKREDIAALLRDRITSGYYAPGSKLPGMRVLVEELGGSRVTMSAALHVLAEEGLVDLSEKSAAVVCSRQESHALHTSWWVRFQLDAAATAQQVRLLAQRFESTTVDPSEGRTTVNAYVSAPSLRQAISSALEVVNSAAASVGLDAAVVQAEAKTEADRIRDLATPAVLDVVGVAEIQEILGINSRQQVGQLAETDEFPRPFVELRAGRIWRRSDIERFKPHWELRQRKRRRSRNT